LLTLMANCACLSEMYRTAHWTIVDQSLSFQESTCGCCCCF